MEAFNTPDTSDTSNDTNPFATNALKLNLSEQNIDLELIQSIPIRLVKRYKFLPVFLIETTLTISSMMVKLSTIFRPDFIRVSNCEENR